MTGWVSNPSSDLDGDGCHDDEDEDIDDDGVLNIPDEDPCPRSPQQEPESIDTDGDGCADINDDDRDGDNRLDRDDDCTDGTVILWDSENQGQDNDQDGCKDNVEDSDNDNDGLNNSLDACPSGWTNFTTSPSNDHDGDGCHDGEDPDIDNDGHNDNVDAFDWNCRYVLDTDDDGMPDESISPQGCLDDDLYDLDMDDDGDGWNDQDEMDCETNPKDKSSYPSDADGDGKCDSREGLDEKAAAALGIKTVNLWRSGAGIAVVILIALLFQVTRALQSNRSKTKNIDNSHNEKNTTVTHEKGSISAGGSVAMKEGQVIEAPPSISEPRDAVESLDETSKPLKDDYYDLLKKLGEMDRGQILNSKPETPLSDGLVEGSNDEEADWRDDLFT
jgi:hypothetical protein